VVLFLSNVKSVIHGIVLVDVGSVIMIDNKVGIASGGRAANATDVWATPWDLIQWVEAEFGQLVLDAAANKDNTKAPDYITPEQDALVTPWLTEYTQEGTTWCNPPYGRSAVKFVIRAIEQVANGNCKRVVMLLASRTDTKMFQDHIFPNASRVHFVKGRLKFGGKGPANFPSVIVVFDKDHEGDATWTFGKCEVKEEE